MIGRTWKFPGRNDICLCFWKHLCYLIFPLLPSASSLTQPGCRRVCKQLLNPAGLAVYGVNGPCSVGISGMLISGSAWLPHAERAQNLTAFMSSHCSQCLLRTLLASEHSLN